MPRQRVRQRQEARLVGVSKKGDRHFRANKNDVFEPGQNFDRLIDEVRYAINRDVAATPAPKHSDIVPRRTPRKLT